MTADQIVIAGNWFLKAEEWMTCECAGKAFAGHEETGGLWIENPGKIRMFEKNWKIIGQDFKKFF